LKRTTKIRKFLILFKKKLKKDAQKMTIMMMMKESEKNHLFDVIKQSNTTNQ